ncbi:hypothetical protein ACJJTC_003396 [Scirpophaga incertulas]
MVRYVIIIYFLLVEMENQHNDLTGPSLQDAPVREGNLLPISPIIPASLSTTINGGVADRAVTSDCRQLGGLNEKPPSHEKGQLSGYHSGQLSSYLAEQLHSRRNERSPSRRSKHSPSRHSRRSPSRRSKRSPSLHSRRSPSRRSKLSPSRRSRRSPSRRNERSPSRRNRRSCSRHNGRSRSRHNGRSRSHHNERSRSRHNGRSRSRHNGRSRSPHHGRSRSHHNGRSRSRHNGRSRSRHNGRSRSRHNGRSRSRHDRLSCTGYSERSCGRPGGQSGKDRTTRSSGHAEESNEKFDGIAADFELIIVPDDAMQVPLLIGQNFTEQRHILTKKTSDLLEFSSLESIENSNSKLKLFCKNKISISGLTIVEIYLDDPRFTGELYVEGSVRYIGYKRYSVMSGLYHIEQGHGCIAVSCTPSSKLILHENSLIARGRIAHHENEKVVLNCYSQRPIVESDINVESNIESKYKQQLLDLLNNYRECFAFDLKELNITRVGDMKIDLNDTEPVVEGKILSALKEDITSSLQDDIIKIREEIKSHIETKQAKEKCQFDKKRCEAIKFQVGDLVRVERQIPSTGQSRKLVPKFQGPYRITDVLEHDRYRIENTPITKKGNRLYSTVVAVDKIEPWLNFKRSHDTDTELSNESE